MFSILNEPFPSDDYNLKRSIFISFLLGLFVSLFLYLLKPFGIEEAVVGSYEFYKILGFGIVTFLGMIIVDLGYPKLFPSYFDEKNYTVLKELLLGIATVFTIATGNILYPKFILSYDMDLFHCLQMLWQTLLVGIFPISWLTLAKYNRLQKINIRASSDITLNRESHEQLQTKKSMPESSPFILDNEKTIELNDVLYMESEGNYVNVSTSKEGELSKHLYRKTLKSLEEELSIPQLIRCHRSFIVNLDKVTAVNGNAQGLKLSIDGCEDIVPVSRKYISVVKKYFS